jgi:hypothetical protein
MKIFTCIHAYSKDKLAISGQAQAASLLKINSGKMFVFGDFRATAPKLDLVRAIDVFIHHKISTSHPQCVGLTLCICCCKL